MTASDIPRAPESRVCDVPGCVDPYGDRYGHHYHCGRCNGPDVTSMYGHLRFDVWRCPPAPDTGTDTDHQDVEGTR